MENLHSFTGFHTSRGGARFRPSTVVSAMGRIEIAHEMRIPGNLNKPTTRRAPDPAINGVMGPL